MGYRSRHVWTLPAALSVAAFCPDGAQAQEQSLQTALNSQQSQTLGQSRMGVEYSVLQREADSNRQIYENLLGRAKEAGISGERRTTNVRVIDQAEVPGGPFMPNVRSDMTFAFMAGRDQPSATDIAASMAASVGGFRT